MRNGMNASFRSVQVSKPKLLHEQVYEQVRELIQSGKLKTGERLPSTQNLAELLQTHVRTIHTALTRLTREGLLVRIPSKGTYVAERTNRLTCVGIYYPEDTFGRSLFLQSLHAALKTELNAQDIETDVWLDPRPFEKRDTPWLPFARAAEHREFQASIIPVTDPQHLAWQTKLPLPTAFCTSPDIPNSVDTDMLQFAELSLRALAEQGCRSVGLIMQADPGYVNKPGEQSMWVPFVERFLAVARDRGLAVKNEWMRLDRIRPDVPLLPQEQFGYEQFLQLWQQPERPDGLVAFPDTVARGAITAMLEKQVRVPAELKLALAKNEAVNLLCPMPATLVISSEREIAKALIEQVQKQFRGETCEPIMVRFTVSNSQ